MVLSGSPEHFQSLVYITVFGVELSELFLLAEVGAQVGAGGSDFGEEVLDFWDDDGADGDSRSFSAL
jgi:hypothetical protein